jgi:hypothetical protein
LTGCLRATRQGCEKIEIEIEVSILNKFTHLCWVVNREFLTSASWTALVWPPRPDVRWSFLQPFSRSAAQKVEKTVSNCVHFQDLDYLGTKGGDVIFENIDDSGVFEFIDYVYSLFEVEAFQNQNA